LDMAKAKLTRQIICRKGGQLPSFRDEMQHGKLAASPTGREFAGRRVRI
jgi:hypothetical protein